MYLVLIVLVAFSVLNTQLMSVLERTKEFGVVMSLGVSPGRLGRLILLETALMGLIGLVVGVVLGGALVVWFGIHGLSFPGLEEMAGQFNLPDRIYMQVSVTGLLLRARRRPSRQPPGLAVPGGPAPLAGARRRHEGGVMGSLRVTLRLAWRNLWRNHRRTLIMLAAVVVGVWAMIFMTALMRGMVDEMVKDGIRTLPGHVQVHHPAYQDDPSVANSLAPPGPDLLAGPRAARRSWPGPPGSRSPRSSPASGAPGASFSWGSTPSASGTSRSWPGTWRRGASSSPPRTRA